MIAAQRRHVLALAVGGVAWGIGVLYHVEAFLKEIRRDRP